MTPADTDGLPSSADATNTARRPNLVVLFGDEHRRDALGVAGNAEVRTPRIDQLAAEGAWFPLACANTPVCTPSRGSMLTGTWPSRHLALANDLPVDPGAPSIARALGSAGYRLGYIGKWHLGGGRRDRFIDPGPERLGFDDLWVTWNCHHSYLQPRWYEGDSPDPVMLGDRYEPILQTDRAIDWIDECVRADEPFCLFLSYGPPHDPYHPLPPGMEDAYEPGALTLRENCADEADTRRDLAAYYTHITALDEQVGRIVDRLRSHSVLDDTIVSFTSDHGTMLGSHGLTWKQQPYEESIGVPLVIRAGSRVPAGTVVSSPIGLVDLAPTLLGLLGVPVPAAMQGRDLSRRVTGDADAGAGAEAGPVYLSEAAGSGMYEREVIGTIRGLPELPPWRGLRDERWTYSRTQNGPWILFDNQSDPWQLNNVVDSPSHRDTVAALDSVLDGLIEAANDPLEPIDDQVRRHGVDHQWDARQREWRTGFPELLAARRAGDDEAAQEIRRRYGWW